MPAVLPDVSVDVRLLDALVLGASVLEPDLDLRVGETERLRQLTAARPRDVLHALVLDLQLQRLLGAERRPLPTSHRRRLVMLRLVSLLLLTLVVVVVMVAFFSCHSDHAQLSYTQTYTYTGTAVDTSCTQFTPPKSDSTKLLCRVAWRRAAGVDWLLHYAVYARTEFKSHFTATAAYTIIWKTSHGTKPEGGQSSHTSSKSDTCTYPFKINQFT